MYTWTLFSIIFVIIAITLVRGQPKCICYENIATELFAPTVIHEPSDGTGRLFTVAWAGIIYIYYRNGTREDKPFLDITDRVVVGGEKGLVGFVTHPNFKENRRFYVYYTTSTHARLSEFHVKEKNLNAGDPKSEVIMIEIRKGSPNHHAGQVRCHLI